MSDNGSNATAVLETLFAYNVWATTKLLEFCERLSDEQLDATATGGYGSIRATLPHIVGAAVDYVERIDGKRPPVALGDTFPGFATLKELARWASDELLRAGLSARADALIREEFPEGRIEYRLASMLAQEITHAAEHRAQIAAIITQLGIQPPDLSVWQYIDEIGEITMVRRGG